MDTDSAQNSFKGAELNSEVLSADQTTNASCSAVSLNNAVPEDSTFCWKKTLLIKPKNSSLGTHVFIVKRIEDEESTDICLGIMKALSSFQTKIFVEEACIEELKVRSSGRLNFDFYELTGDDEANIDLIIVIGGDGSILWALKYFQHREAPPVLAFSKGTVNYLCNFPIANYEATIKKIMEGINCGKSFKIEQRSRLQCEILNKEKGQKKTIQALNEIVMDRGINPTIIRLDCHLEGKYFATFEGDGVMVATPTGSTAYQLSAGGPIMNHLNSSLAVTPIAPMNLATRPVVLPNNINLTFKLKDESRKTAFLSADGHTRVEITKGSEVRITGNQHSIAFILDEDKDTLDNWIYRLRNLLGWNKKI